MNEKEPRGLPGDYADDAGSMKRKVRRAVARGTGCKLTADEAMALNLIQGDGEWWQS